MRPGERHVFLVDRGDGALMLVPTQEQAVATGAFVPLTISVGENNIAVGAKGFQGLFVAPIIRKGGG